VNNKEKLKLLMASIKKSIDKDFEKNLPLPKEFFVRLFEYLESELTDNKCDDTLKLTKLFLIKYNIENIDKVTEWLVYFGGYCDCTVIHNVQDQFN
jgi:hypothetical protein